MIALDPATGVFTVSGGHTYGEDGSYSVTTTVDHEGVVTPPVISTATVSDPAVVALGGFTFAATKGARRPSRRWQRSPTRRPRAQPQRSIHHGGPLRRHDRLGRWQHFDGDLGQRRDRSWQRWQDVHHQTRPYLRRGGQLLHHHDHRPRSDPGGIGGQHQGNGVRPGGRSHGRGGQRSRGQTVLWCGGGDVHRPRRPGSRTPSGLTTRPRSTGATGRWSPGTITFDPGTGVFTVSGNHTYTKGGTYTITTTINHEGVDDITVTSSATVKDNLGLLVLDPAGKELSRLPAAAASPW